jgi:hypothetical protein
LGREGLKHTVAQRPPRRIATGARVRVGRGLVGD